VGLSLPGAFKFLAKRLDKTGKSVYTELSDKDDNPELP
jgi:hypothetical protein